MPEHDPSYPSYVMVDITQPIRVSLGRMEDGYYYYDENWQAYEGQYLTFPLIEIHDESERNRMAISHLLLVRGSKMATVWTQSWFRGRKRDIPYRYRLPEQVHYDRVRQLAHPRDLCEM